MTNKKHLITLLLSCFIVAVILVLGTIFDLSISKNLCILEEGQYWSSNGFVAFFEILGENVLYIILASAVAIIYNFFYKKTTERKVAKNIILLCCSILELGIFIFFAYKTITNASNHASIAFVEFFSYFQSKILVLVICGLLSYITMFIFSKFSLETLSVLINWAFIVIIVAALSNGIVQGLKHIVHRTRFRAMLYVGDENFEYYTNWFILNKNTFNSVLPMASDFFKSFPSGHACAGTSILLICLLPNFTKKLNKRSWRISLITISSIYCILLDLSRIMAGAHFLTDVLIGSLTTIVMLLLVNFLYKKKLKQKFEKVNNF